MRLIVPFTSLRAETLTAIRGSWGSHSLELAPVKDDEHYWRILRDAWAAQITFAIVEQDVVIGPRTLDQLYQCKEDWCTLGYPFFGRDKPQHGLACVKFSARLLARHPHLMTAVGAIGGDEVHPSRHWCRLDAHIYRVLNEWGEQRHEHPETVGHLNDWTSHGCVPRPGLALQR